MHVGEPVFFADDLDHFAGRYLPYDAGAPFGIVTSSPSDASQPPHVQAAALPEIRVPPLQRLNLGRIRNLAYLLASSEAGCTQLRHFHHGPVGGAIPRSISAGRSGTDRMPQASGERHFPRFLLARLRMVAGWAPWLEYSRRWAARASYLGWASAGRAARSTRRK